MTFLRESPEARTHSQKIIEEAWEGRATLKAYLNPLINWIWIGGAVVILGSWLAMLPDLRERRRGAEARLREAERDAA